MGGPAAARRLRAFDWGRVCENNEKNVFDLNIYIYIYVYVYIYIANTPANVSGARAHLS